MSVGVGLRILMIVIGLVILIITIVSLARRHMTESFCIVWGIVAIMAICAGIILRPSQWNKYISWGGLLLILFGLAFLLAGAFFFSVRISQLTRQVKELAILVSLLNQENAMILNELSGVSAESEVTRDEEENLVRH